MDCSVFQTFRQSYRNQMGMYGINNILYEIGTKPIQRRTYQCNILNDVHLKAF